MSKGRLEAFSDGVIAIIITIMVLEFKTPAGSAFASLRPMVPTFLSYVLSFVYVGIYWNNHHHLLHAVEHVEGVVLWANLNLLFWLSLTPFATAWMGSSHFASGPVSLYGALLLMSALAYYILTNTLVAHHGPDSTLARSIGKDSKGRISIAVYTAAIPLAFISSWIACAGYVSIAVMWLLPDPRIERALDKRG